MRTGTRPSAAVAVTVSVTVSVAAICAACGSLQGGPGGNGGGTTDAGTACNEHFSTAFDDGADGGIVAGLFGTHTPDGGALAWSGDHGATKPGSLEATVRGPGQAQIDETFPGVPTSARVSFATLVAENAPGANLAFGCAVQLMLVDNGYVSMSPRASDTDVGVDIGSSTPPDVPSAMVKPIDPTHWLNFVLEMKDITTSQVSLAATLDGAPVPLEATTMSFTSPPKDIRIICGIDDAKAPAKVYVDDLDISICTH